jgi:hypothetical protein
MKLSEVGGGEGWVGCGVWDAGRTGRKAKGKRVKWLG